MTQPVSYVEINSPDRQRSARFMTDVFGWQFRPFADPGSHRRSPARGMSTHSLHAAFDSHSVARSEPPSPRIAGLRRRN